MQSMEEIYQRYAQTVYRYLFSVTRDHDLSEELTQETYYQAIRSIDRYDGSCKISTWLCAIAKNQLRLYRRRHPEMQEWETNDTAVPSAEQDVFRGNGRIEILKKLHECPEPGREVLYLRIFGCLSFKEIGEIMGKTENWARVTYYRSKEKLRKELGDYEE
ncbi:MAG: sigma-70 family RNA polymerase sigma factor [Lachnospiraceae bacterium]|nr:sigma-70 family RNA polymerase sigma factor [Lachnospiraceae bacterium]